MPRRFSDAEAAPSAGKVMSCALMLCARCLSYHRRALQLATRAGKGSRNGSRRGARASAGAATQGLSLGVDGTSISNKPSFNFPLPFPNHQFHDAPSPTFSSASLTPTSSAYAKKYMKSRGDDGSGTGRGTRRSVRVSGAVGFDNIPADVGVSISGEQHSP